MEIGAFNDGSVGFSVYTDAGTLALDIDDNQESTFSGAVTLPQGSEAAPSINFSGSTTTGFYRSASNVIDVSISGQQKVSFTNTGVDFKTGITAEAEVTFQKRAQLNSVSVPVSIAGNFDINVRNGNTFKISMAASGQVNFGNFYLDGDVYWLHVSRTTSSPATISWGPNIKWVGVPSQSSGNSSAVDVYQFNVIGSIIYGSVIGVGY